MSHVVQVARFEDFSAIAALDRVAWGEETFIPDGEHVWRVWCEHATVLVIRNPDHTRGPRRADDDDVAAALVMFPTHDGRLFLHKIMVDPHHRGQGMGTALMAAALEQVAAPVLLTVDPNNEAAIELYRRYGFAVDHYVEGYYRPHEHRYVMIYRPHG